MELSEVIKIISIGIVTAFTALILKNQKPEFSLYISLVGGAVLLYIIASKAGLGIQAIQQIAEKANIQFPYIALIIKILVISYLVEFSAHLCRDAGETAIASKVELGGRIAIFLISIPILTAIFSLIQSLLPE